MRHFTSHFKTYLSLSFVLIFVSICYAATYTVNNTCTNCNWATNGTWAGNAVPPNWGSHTVNVDGGVLLTASTTQLLGFAAINVNGGKSFTSGSIGTPNNLSIQSVNFNIVNGVMTVYGDLTLNSGANLLLTSGSLVVTGTLTLNGGTLTVANNQSVTIGNLTLTSSGGSAVTNNGNITVNGTVSQSGPITNSSTGLFQVNGNHTMVNTGAAVFTNTGRVNVTGNLTIPGSAKFYVNPDGETYVDGNVTVTANENLVIGTNVNPPPYADMVIKQDLISTGSGDITINRNGRLAVFGDVDVNGGGSIFTINSGGQVYVDGDISMVGGGNHIVNNNTTSPYGLYTDGTVSYAGGGSNTTGHPEGDVDDMYNEDRPFYDWVAGLPGSPLPIKLLFFRVNEVSAEGIALHWVTTFEKDFAYFQIQRAGSNLIFEPIGSIEGYGGLDINTPYHFEDTTPLNGKNYYRLKSVDIDGRFEYSSVVVGDWRSRATAVYPNPVVNYKFTVSLNTETDAAAILQLLDGAGNQIIEEQVVRGNTEMQLSENTKAGLYFLKIISNGDVEIIKVIVP